MMRYVLLGSLLLLGCGSSSASARNHPGTGSSTLSVKANVEESSSPRDGQSTNFSARIRDGLGNAVSGATVKFQNGDFGEVVLAETSSGSGDYAASRPSVSNQDVTLSVVRGSDNVQGVTVGNPGMSAFTAPNLSAPIPANQSLTVHWTVPEQVQSAELSTKDFQANVADNGSYTIPGANNPPRTDQVLSLRRINEVTIAGALSGTLTLTTNVESATFTVQ